MEFLINDQECSDLRTEESNAIFLDGQRSTTPCDTETERLHNTIHNILGNEDAKIIPQQTETAIELPLVNLDESSGKANNHFPSLLNAEMPDILPDAASCGFNKASLLLPPPPPVHKDLSPNLSFIGSGFDACGDQLVLFNRVILEDDRVISDQPFQNVKMASMNCGEQTANGVQIRQNQRLSNSREKVGVNNNNNNENVNGEIPVINSYTLTQENFGNNLGGHAAKYEAASDWRNEPIHMTLEEVRSSINSFMEPSGVSESCKFEQGSSCMVHKRGGSHNRKNPFTCMKIKKAHEAPSMDHQMHHNASSSVHKGLLWSFKDVVCGWLGIKQASAQSYDLPILDDDASSLRRKSNIAGSCQNFYHSEYGANFTHPTPYVNRALPPVPVDDHEMHFDQNETSDAIYQKCLDRRLKDFSSSIQKVKDYGWYWGPLSGETAEKILANEPDGSFIVRDSSDEHYIFSLTFKLNGLVRHVRIEHDQGTFSFGTLTNFKSHTIVEFIENAVAHSRSGRYLFFLHHRPVLGPMRVQLLYPVSRFKQVQSLQHMCRFVILKVVRLDHICKLPLPKQMQDYLNTPQYYSEVVQEIQQSLQIAKPVSASSNVEGDSPTLDEIRLQADEVLPLLGVSSEV